MSNYIKTTDFAAKDALPSGNPAKVAQGTQVDTEFNNIATAVATKEDTANRAVPNGYASLDGSGDVPDAQIPATIPRLASLNVFTGQAQTLSSAQPELRLIETDGAADNKSWGILANAEAFIFRTRNDAVSTSADFFTVNRTGITVDSLALAATTVTVNGQDVRNTAILTAGTLADARVAQSNVTQHQAALSIAETQIPDGSLFARVGDSETITGTWIFDTDLTITSSSAQLVFIETGVTADNTRWDFIADAEAFSLRTRNDANSAGATPFNIQRTGTTVDSIALTSTALTWNGNTIFTTANDGTGSGLDADLLDGSHAAAFATASHNHSASEVTSGTFADARISQSSVTQHEAALSLTGDQVSASTITNTGAFAVDSTYAENFAVCNSAGPLTVTVGTNCLGATGRAAVFIRRGAGTVVFAAGGGVTINSPGAGLTINQQHGKAALIQITSTVFELSGNI